MKFYEAIELGNTLIGETRFSFYNPTTNCGCAIGSALAAMGKLPEKGLNTGGVIRTEILWPWTAKRIRDFPTLFNESQKVYSIYGWYSVAAAVSLLHIRGMKRMDIAKLLKPIEDNLPENLSSLKDDSSNEVCASHQAR